jgi:hypothetical protein
LGGGLASVEIDAAELSDTLARAIMLEWADSDLVVLGERPRKTVASAAEGKVSVGPDGLDVTVRPAGAQDVASIFAVRSISKLEPVRGNAQLYYGVAGTVPCSSPSWSGPREVPLYGTGSVDLIRRAAEDPVAE